MSWSLRKVVLLRRKRFRCWREEYVGTSQPLLSSLQRSKSQQGALEAKSWQVQAAAELGRWAGGSPQGRGVEFAVSWDSDPHSESQGLQAPQGHACEQE